MTQADVVEVYELMSCTERISSDACDLNISSNSKSTGHEMMLVRARFGGKKKKSC